MTVEQVIAAHDAKWNVAEGSSFYLDELRRALTAEELRGLLAKLRASEAVQRHDLLGPNILFIATGLRISELLGLYWADFDDAAATLTINRTVVTHVGVDGDNPGHVAEFSDFGDTLELWPWMTTTPR